jgi:hypothetical protein
MTFTGSTLLVQGFGSADIYDKLNSGSVKNELHMGQKICMENWC